MNTLYYISLSIILIDSLLGLALWLSKKLEKDMFPIVLAATCSILDEAIAYYFKIKFKNNLIVYYISDPIEYSLFAWFLYLNIKSLLIKKVIRYSILAMIGFATLFSLFYVKYAYTDPFNANIVQSYFTIAKGLLLTVWCISYFKDIFDRISKFEYLNVYVMLITSGMLFYFAFSAVFFASENYLVNSAIKENPNLLTDIFKIKAAAFSYAYKQLKNVYPFLYLTNILLYLCIFVALFKNLFTTKKYTLGS